MSYAQSKNRIDQLAAALGPNQGSYENVPNQASSDATDLDSKKREYIKKCERPKFIDDWNQERPLNMPEAIAKSIEERQARGEDTEADLNKAVFTYRNRNQRNWSKVDLEKMEKAEKDEELTQKGKFVKFG